MVVAFSVKRFISINLYRKDAAIFFDSSATLAKEFFCERRTKDNRIGV